MRFSLIPREMKFFDMFDEFAITLTRAAGKFHEMVTAFDKLEIRSQEMKREEDACDASVEKIIKALDHTFITPFDREDIHTLATNMDDIMDNMEKTSYRLEVFRIDRPTPEMVELAHIISECCIRVEAAVKLLRNLRDSDKIHALLREIGRIEKDAEMLCRGAEAPLFAGLLTNDQSNHIREQQAPPLKPITPADILMLIKWRELYQWLKATIDACRRVADVISEIVIKGT